MANTLYMESRENGTDDLICRADVENELMDTAGQGEGGMNWQSRTDMHALLYVRQGAGKLLHSTESPPLGALLMTSRVEREGGGRGV